MMRLEDNLEVGFTSAPTDEPRYEAPLAQQMGDFRDFGTETPF
ncbi:MAG: hypothetical protein ABSG59_19650 [Verrucomicrobiota bacterium]|jgi:hypothetical protein